MKAIKNSIFSFFLIFSSSIAWGQDLHFSQFFMAPQSVNPALVGTSSGNWRVMGNYRNQWGSAGTPFNTLSFSADAKILKERIKNIFGGGFMFISDQSMNGAFKSVYASGALSYHLALNENHNIGMGAQVTYGNRRINYSALSFGEQFTSGGFDLTLPTGESALSSMKPFISIGAGVLYSYNSDYINIDLGASIFHLNKPRQSFMNDPNQYIPMRYVVNGNIEYSASDRISLSFYSMYQHQASQQYIVAGGALGYDISNGEGDKILYLGAWYRQNDAVYPFLGLAYNSLQIGFSYDFTISKLNKGFTNPRSFEISLLFKQRPGTPGIIACPW